jgi:hypothetical protein
MEFASILPRYEQIGDGLSQVMNKNSNVVVGQAL